MDKRVPLSSRSVERLLRVRQAAVEEARRDLASSIEAEQAAHEALAAAERRIAVETEIAHRSETTDQQVEAFGVWLRSGLRVVQHAMQVRERAAADTARHRAIVGRARSDLLAAEAINEAQHELRARAEERAEQQELAEICASPATAALAQRGAP
jgi:hypothetical protein